MKAAYLGLSALFLYMVYIQFNDPDPLYWIVVYGGVAAVALGHAFGKASDFWTVALIGATLGGMIIAAPGFVEFVAAGDIAAMGDMRNAGYVEPAREFGGLLIALGALVYCYKARTDTSH
ncbi:MAG: transmembrane 220 family protein [Pseudomonadota bacterium]